MQDSAEYKAKKAFFKNVLTLYGRKPCLEALEDNNLVLHKLHLADSNRPAPIIKRMIILAKSREIDIEYHDKKTLSRISKNSQQDQGVAIDCILHGLNDVSKLAIDVNKPVKLIALDNVTNPQNLGMIIRSVCASGCTGLLLPDKGCAKLDALVIKASAGTLFKATIFRCENLQQTLLDLRERDFQVVGLGLQAEQSLTDFKEPDRVVYVLGNESDGISNLVGETCSQHIKIRMSNNVESLNVAVTAALIAFKGIV